MTKEEIQALLKNLNITEGEKKTAKAGSYEARFPKQEQLSELLTQMKGILQQQLSKEEVELSQLKEKLVKARKGGSNG